MATTVRAFIALDLPAGMQTSLDKIVVPLRRELTDMPLRWVRIANIHITLKFLGPMQPNEIDKLKSSVADHAARFASIPVEFDGLGTFPNAHKPLVLWVGLRAGPALADLQRSLESSLAAQGFASDDRPFTPHLTIARVRRDHRVANLKRIGEIMAAAKLPSLPSATLEELTLYRSDLKAGGSVYNPLFRARLSGISEGA